MTRKEAESIRDLQIPIDNLTEDCFYMFMAEKGRIPEENKKKSLLRIKTYAQEIPFDVLSKAKKMVDNIDKYGVPCAEWCED